MIILFESAQEGRLFFCAVGEYDVKSLLCGMGAP